ncbi:MAG: hypothetical protein KDD18_00195 [Mangrovimonas sp.]|nr:hypothetical protein [Mangrovimonas sp.]
MKTLITNLFIFLFSICSYSQQKVYFSNGAFQDGGNRNNLFLDIDNNEEDKTEGSRFINDNFLPAKLNDSDDIFFLRYDAFNEVFEISKNEKIYSLNKHIENVTISFLNLNLVYKAFTVDGTEKYFVLLNNENQKINLLKKESIIFTEEKLSKTGYDEYRPPKYKRGKDVFFMHKDGEVIELPTNKKKFAALFPEKEDQILDHIKKAKSSKLNDGESLLELFNYINSIYK